MIATTTSSVSFNGNNSTSTAYPFTFPLSDPSHLVVQVTTAAGVTTTLSYPSGFNRSVNRDGNGRITGGTVTTVAAVPVDSTLTILRRTPALQTLDLIETGTISAETLESALDVVSMAIIDAARDATGGGESNVSAAGTGLIVQTAAETFAARTLLAGTGITITNPDGVAEAPTISTSLDSLDVVTTAALSVLTRIGNNTITLDNLAGLLRPTFNVFEIPASRFTPASTGGAAVESVTYTAGDTTTTQIVAKFPTSGNPTAYVHFSVPHDYGTGDILIRPRLAAVTATGGNSTIDFSWSFISIGSTTSAVGSGTPTGMTSSPFNSTSHVAVSGAQSNQQIALKVARNYSGNATDTFNGEVRILGLEILYPTRRVPAWS